ncbi:MAG: SURF1 family protein [Pseudomonadota bacterium]
MARRRKSLLFPILFGTIGTAILIALGVWQMQRLEWKEALIADIEARMAADPVPIPDQPSPEADRLLRVAVSGKMGTREIHVISSVKPIGPGFRVIVPMEVGSWKDGTGRWILVDLGFVPERLKDPKSREATSVRWKPRLYQDEVVGLLHWPKEADGFTPEPDLEKNIWFARDVPKMAEWLKTDPVMVIAETHPDGEWPRPRPPGVGVPNRHLEYALTWFGLAIVWVVMTIVLVRGQRAARKAPGS